MDRIISVTGEGSASAAPDAIMITGEFSEVFQTYEEAVNASADALSSLRKAIGNAGFDMNDLRTASLSVDPEYRSDSKGNIAFSGYRFSHRLSIVEDSDPETVGKILSALIECEGSPQFRVEYIMRDDSAVRSEARKDAVRDAKHKARELADAVGMRLGDIVSVSYGPDGSFGGPSMRLMTCMNVDAVPKDLEFTDTVTIQWTLV